MLALPKQMSFLTISNENILSSKGLETAVMLQTVREEIVDEKELNICLVSMFPSRVMVLKLSKKVYFLQFCADLNKKPKSAETSHYTLTENDLGWSLSHHS